MWHARARDKMRQNQKEQTKKNIHSTLHLVRWRQIGTSLTSTLETSPVFVANGCLIYEETELSLPSPPVGYFILCVIVQKT